MTDLAGIIRWTIPLLMAFSSAVGAYIGVLHALAAMRLELYRELARRDLQLEGHEQRLHVLEKGHDELIDEFREHDRAHG